MTDPRLRTHLAIAGVVTVLGIGLAAWSGQPVPRPPTVTSAPTAVAGASSGAGASPSGAGADPSGAVAPSGPTTVPEPSGPRATLREPSEPLPTYPCVPGATAVPAVSPGRFELTIAGCDGDFPLDVTLIDETGVVTAIAAVEPVPEFATFGLTAAPTPLVGLDYTWAGGCDVRTTLTLKRSAATFAIERVTEAPRGPCFAVLLFRQLRILTSEPIDPGRVAIPSDEP